MKHTNFFFTVTLFTFISCLGFSKKEENIQKDNAPSQNTKVAYFAGGCFWCVEAIFEGLKGVEEAVSGYAGGHTTNPTYGSTGKGDTGHAEAVAVYYDPKIISFETLLKVYYGSHNPTTKNGQHPDYGSQYRSIVFYSNGDEKAIIEAMIAKLNKDVYDGKVATEVQKFTKFYKAEEYHQNFEKRNPNQNYVLSVSIPRLNRFKKKFPELLKEE